MSLPLLLLRYAGKAISLSLILLMLLNGCHMVPSSSYEKPFSVRDLPGWGQDELEGFVTAFTRSCTQLTKRRPEEPFFKDGFHPMPLTYGDWQNVCTLVTQEPPADPKEWVEKHFEAIHVSHPEHTTEGLFTGYYEPLLHGAWHKSKRYSSPLYKRPKDLVILEDLAQGNGRRITGRYHKRRFLPYWTRREIFNGALKGRQEELLWVDSEVDNFFLHIQGSGIVQLPDKTLIRVGYDSANGHPYVAIGKELVNIGALKVEEVSMQSIRAWLKAHPRKAQKILNLNPSYVFFRLNIGEGPIGSQGVPLTPLRSLAVDRRFLPLGVPLWLDTVDPDDLPLQRMLIAQDTGGAIKGLIRGDIFWGNGLEAADKAGRMKSAGRYYLLVPKTSHRQYHRKNKKK